MIPTKQTVYLPVNGESLLVVCYDNSDWYDSITGVVEKKGYFFTPEQLNEYTGNVIKQALETAAENVTYMKECGKVSNENCYKLFCHNCFDIVNKQSITNTFDEIFNKVKV